MKAVEILALSILALDLGGCATSMTQAAGNTTTAASAAPTVSAQTPVNTILFVQSAERARVSPVAKGSQTYTITLYGVKPRVLWFADHSQQPAGTYPLTNFINDWNNPQSANFIFNKPNGAFMTTHVENNDTGRDFAPVFTLSQPIYNKRQNSLSYQATLVNGSSKPQYMYYHDVALFIEGSCGSSC